MKNANTFNSLLTTGEAAEILGYNEVYLRQLLRQGVIRGAQINREWVLFRSDVESFVKPKRGKPRQKRVYTKKSPKWSQFTIKGYASTGTATGVKATVKSVKKEVS